MLILSGAYNRLTSENACSKNRSENMACAFGFPRDVTDLISSMRDWRLEEVRRSGGTPSALSIRRLMEQFSDGDECCRRIELGLDMPWERDRGPPILLWWCIAEEEDENVLKSWYEDTWEHFEVLRRRRDEALRNVFFQCVHIDL